jgi:two-component system, cell cycle sensor histidine kinase and response regulator CckA
MMGYSATILLVENGEMLRPLLREILLREGYEVLAARNAEEALSMWDRQQGQIDLIVTDVMMPGLSGKELVERLRSLSPEVKVIYMSGYDTRLISASPQFGPKAVFLQKPFRPAELSQTVREILGSC